MMGAGLAKLKKQGSRSNVNKVQGEINYKVFLLLGICQLNLLKIGSFGRRNVIFCRTNWIGAISGKRKWLKRCYCGFEKKGKIISS